MRTMALLLFCAGLMILVLGLCFFNKRNSRFFLLKIIIVLLSLSVVVFGIGVIWFSTWFYPGYTIDDHRR